MKKILLLSSALVLVAALTMSFVTKSESEVESEVKELVLNAYVNGAFNGLDADAMRKGFHKDFAIYSPKGEDISKYPIAV